MFKYIDGVMFVYFFLGGVIGVLVVLMIVILILFELMKIVVVVFVFYLLWGVMLKFREILKLWCVFVGFWIMFILMFVGVSGFLVGSCLYVNNYNKFKFIVIFLSCMIV